MSENLKPGSKTRPANEEKDRPRQEETDHVERAALSLGDEFAGKPRNA